MYLCLSYPNATKSLRKCQISNVNRVTGRDGKGRERSGIIFPTRIMSRLVIVAT